MISLITRALFLLCTYSVFVQSEIAPLDPPTRGTRKTKHEVDRMSRCRDVNIWIFSNERSVGRWSSVGHQYRPIQYIHTLMSYTRLRCIRTYRARSKNTTWQLGCADNRRICSTVARECMSPDILYIWSTFEGWQQSDTVGCTLCHHLHVYRVLHNKLMSDVIQLPPA